ncbi:Gasdermin-E, partial [Galemys pyrenaicus]
ASHGKQASLELSRWSLEVSAVRTPLLPPPPATALTPERRKAHRRAQGSLWRKAHFLFRAPQARILTCAGDFSQSPLQRSHEERGAARLGPGPGPGFGPRGSAASRAPRPPPPRRPRSGLARPAHVPRARCGSRAPAGGAEQRSGPPSSPPRPAPHASPAPPRRAAGLGPARGASAAAGLGAGAGRGTGRSAPRSGTAGPFGPPFARLSGSSPGPVSHPLPTPLLPAASSFRGCGGCQGSGYLQCIRPAALLPCSFVFGSPGGCEGFPGSGSEGREQGAAPSRLRWDAGSETGGRPAPPPAPSPRGVLSRHWDDLTAGGAAGSRVNPLSTCTLVVESDFVKYEGKFENQVSGSVETALGTVKLNVGGKGLVESQSSFGTLRKQEVDLQQLIRDAAERKINLKNPVLQQVLERKNEVLCVLTQRIVTTQKCVISEHVQIEEKCGGMVGIQTKTVQVSAMEDGNFIKDTNVVLEIPAATTTAYGVIELYVKQDGQFGDANEAEPTPCPRVLFSRTTDFCLLQGKRGGFEQERSCCVFLDPLPFRELAFQDMPDGWQRPLSILKQAAPLLEKNFHPFAELPEQQQTALSDVLQAILLDEELLVVLEQVCDDVVFGLSPPLEMLGELKSPQQQDLTAFLRLVGYSVQGRCPGPEDVVSNQKLFSIAYFLVSALAEMPDNAAALLGTCCKLQMIPTLCYLLHALSDDGVADLEDPALAPLKATERFGIVQRLFASADISLERRQSSVKAVVQTEPHGYPLILYISLNGLGALDRAH